MFIETDSGRLQNLYLLQDVRVLPIEDSDKFTIGYIQANGAIIKEGSFDSEEEAEIKRTAIISKLLA